MRTKKYSDRLNLSQSINWVKKQKSLAQPPCQTCGLRDAVGFDFNKNTVDTVCARGHKSTWHMTPCLWVMMKEVHKLLKKNGCLQY